ncbi:two-component sensor histidine kinase [Paramagnetospirillum marisnigri]|uniref:histidine kinase n=1 Tax=Paramagnetospirillum marisnigri TaxID=1285242 RepID=A0A178MF41_9PROT|nr:ATP-binding protein [Paramagnetospirillum marisnigri]OAN46688.1 two-component sensor histidine kinase [Paramagnetospirillum marisnigri]
MDAPTPTLATCRPAGQPRPPEQVRRLLRLLVALVLVLMIGGVGAVIIHLRQADIEEAASGTQGVARLLDEHLSRMLSGADSILMRAAEISRSRLDGQITAAEELRRFQELVTTLPERGALVSTDAKGLVVNSTAAPESAGGVSLAARPWFQAVAAGAPVVVGPMFRARIHQRLIFTVSRPVTDAHGRFAGMVSVGIDVGIFADYHRSLVLGRDGFVAASTNNQIVLRQPRPEDFVDNPFVGGTLAEATAAEPNGTTFITLETDGIERIISYRTLPVFNVVVVAGMGVDQVLAPWRRTALFLGGGILVIAIGLSGVARMAFRAIDNEEAIARGLEAAVRQRTLEAEQRAEEARQANDSKTRFLAAASHDLRQPLQAAGMFTEVLSSRVTEPSQIMVVDKLRQSIEATNSLLTSLLDVSTLEAGKIKPNIATFHLMPLLARLAEQMEPEASVKGLSIGAITTSAQVVSDPVLLERMLRNLLVNAVRYTESGGIRIGCRRRGDAMVAIQVWDTGIGIPVDKLQAVFDDFTRLDAIRDRKGNKGLGLGLGVVRRMAVLLDHGLDLKSVPGKGSCFTVLVKRA